jgi:hypothetical protein
MESGPFGGRAGKSSAAAIAGPGRLWADRPLKGRGVVLSSTDARIQTSMMPASFAASPASGYAARSMNRATSCGASWTRMAACSAADAQKAQILVEIGQSRREGDRLDPGRLRSFGQRGSRAFPRWIMVAGDIEPAQRVGQTQCREVSGGQSGGHRHGRQHAAQRQ